MASLLRGISTSRTILTASFLVNRFNSMRLKFRHMSFVIWEGFEPPKIFLPYGFLPVAFSHSATIYPMKNDTMLLGQQGKPCRPMIEGLTVYLAYVKISPLSRPDFSLSG